MTRDEILRANALAPNADMTHEDSRSWYDSYGWSLSTDNDGDVCLQVVEYDWLDDDDATVIDRLQREHDVTDEDASVVVTMARTVREAAEAICSLLDGAVYAYGARDVDETRRCLLAAYDLEMDHGDAPAAATLAGALLASVADGWYLLDRAGCAWIAVQLCGGKVVDTIEQANAETHLAAGDRYASVVRDILEGTIDDADDAEAVVAAYEAWSGSRLSNDAVSVSEVG